MIVNIGRLMIVNIGQAKTQFSRLLKKAVRGEEVIIAKAERPIAKLVPIGMTPRKLGTAKGDFVVPDDFNDPLPKDIEDSFRN